ncbi:MAG TPA: ammonia channel protein, partial [Phenylobacterium sp.]|nr:ammonia channel protein [Phenylobacterium sp.]
MKFIGFKRLAGLALAAAVIGAPFAGTALAQTAAAPAAPAPEAAAPAATPAPDAAAPAAAAAAPTAPAPPKIDTGDTAWMLTSSVLVLMMTIPGLALFYAGMVRKKNILATLAQSFSATALITVLWMVIGYSLAFTDGGKNNALIGGVNYLLLGPMGLNSTSPLAATIPESVYMFFQMTFAIITPALIAGALADRMKFSAFLAFMGAWLLLVYCPIAHWVWGGGWLGKAGALDYAGGTVVHLNAGTAGLVAALMLGKRKGLGVENMAPHNLAYSVIGASLLWVGWFGFNAGSAVTSNVNAGMAAAATQIATA